MISEYLKLIEKEYPPVVGSDAFRELKRRFTKDRMEGGDPVYQNIVLFHVRNYYGLSHEEILMKKRRREIVLPRQVAMYLMAGEPKGKKERPNYADIGRVFDKDHTTVMYACQTIRGILSYDNELRESLRLIKERIKSE